MSTTRARSRVTGSSLSSAGTVPNPLNVLAEAAATVETLPQRTRSGRVSKPPERYVPIEQVEDDYEPEDYDTDEPDDDSDDIDTESDEEDEDESDADDDGNLAGFVVPDKSESDEDDNGEPSLPKATKRAPVKKRPATRK